MFAAVIMWTFLALLFAMPFALMLSRADTRRRQRNGLPVSSGGIGAIDAVFAPSAAEARAVWEAQTEIPAPAPTPGDGPGVIRRGRITIELAS
ncbi:hypothetical protein ACFC1I_11045 [Microbacterium sp. NPDC056044]|uniref:hypothetical protein n=1 Tax=Microbacterium sp. NPDC056044 TaxID=3345690 RepID=UPI0035D9AC07